MSQAAYEVLDQDGASFLVTINEILAAIRTSNSDATEPNETYPFMTWVDTASGAVKQRNSADDAWITLYILTSGQLAQLNGMTLTGAINYKRATVAADATATALWTAANGNIQDWTGTPTITDFPAAPQAGAKREVYPAAGTIITNAGNVSVQGNANRTSEAGEKWLITAVTTTTFYVEVIKKDGTAVVSNTISYASDAEYVAGLESLKVLTPLVARANNLVLGSAVTLTNQTFVDFTIPSWAKEIIISFAGVSTNGSVPYLVQLGDAGGIETSGYTSTSLGQNSVGGAGGVSSTAGFIIYNIGASATFSGQMLITKTSSLQFVSTHNGKFSTTECLSGGGDKTLSDTLTTIRVTTTNGTDQFDAGTLNATWK